jgi:hypothetical protein
MAKITILILCFTFSTFSPIFAISNNLSNKNVQIIYKAKPKKKTSDKNKLDRSKKSYWEKSNKIFHRFFKSSIYSDNNPANLGINSPFYNFRFDLPSINIQLANKSISPQMIIDHFTTGEQLSINAQNEVYSNLSNIHLLSQMNINPFRLEFRKFRFSSELVTLINGDFSGEILSIPFSNLNLGSDFDQKLDIEMVSFLKNSIGIGHTYKTKFATLRGGVNYNYYKGIIYAKTFADTFNLTNNLDNVSTKINLSVEGSELFWNSIEGNTVDETQLGEISNGFDIGFGVNLKKLIRQNLDIELIIKNIGATLTFKNAKNEIYSNEINVNNIVEFADSIHLLSEGMDTIIINKDIEINIPRKTILKATYQPIPQFVFSGGFEKYSTQFLSQQSKPNIHLRAGYFPTNWFHLSYGLKTNNEQIVQSIGTGVQTGVMDILLNLSSYDGILNRANGLGLGFRISFYL